MMVTVMVVVVVVLVVMMVGVVYLQHEQWANSHPHPVQWVRTTTPTAAPHVHRENIAASATRRCSGHHRTAKEDEMNLFS